MTLSRTQQAAAVVAGSAGVALVVLGAYFGPSADGRRGHQAGSAAASSTSTTPSTPLTTTTTAPAAVAPTAPPRAPPSAAADPGDGSSQSLGVDPPPVKPPPDGIKVASDPATCTWDSADGGTLRASGTIANTANGGNTWLVAVDWNDAEGFLDNESDFFTAAPGQTTPWSLTVVGADPPTGTLTCAVQVT